MHDVAVLLVSSQEVGDDFTECLGENTFVYVFDSVVYILF
jgi:hypothetical protein